jgi:hypothetical protein
LIVRPEIQSDATLTYFGIGSFPSTAAASFTLPQLNHFDAGQSTFGAGSSVTNQVGFFANSSLTGATNNYGFYSNIASGTGRWNFYANGTADNYFAGNVGIGTTSPSTGTLNRQLTINSGASGLAGVLLQNNATGTSFNNGTYFAILNGTDASITNQQAGYLQFGTNNTERMRIDSSGNLLVGTTSNITGDPRLFAQGSSGQTAFGCYRPTSTTTSNVFRVFSDVGGAATFNAQILANGNVQNTNNSYGAISDSKLKENIVDATPKLNQLCQVKIRNYNLIGYTTKQIGVVAQELEQIFPSMVEETPDTDSKGNDLGTTTKSVKYSIFVPMLIKAIQELNAKVEALEAQLNKE